jgi:hypothetical protein
VTRGVEPLPKAVKGQSRNVLMSAMKREFIAYFGIKENETNSEKDNV